MIAMHALVSFNRASGRRRLASTLAVLLALAVVLAGCGKTSESTSSTITDREIRVVATIGMIGDVVSNIGGDRVEVTTLMGAGVDPHLYKATEQDVRTLEEADVIFYNGLHLEAGLGEVLEQMGDRTRTVAVTDRIPRESLFSPPEYEGNYDPHVWFDVSLWKLAAEQIRDTLIEIDPEHRSGYEERAMGYLGEMDGLDTYVRSQAERIPAERRVLITAHDAFGYFGAAYGFEVRGLQGVSTATEAGTLDVQELAQFIADRQIPAIFVESSVPRRNIEAVQEAVRSRGWDVQIGGELYSDAMGDQGTEEGTYLGMVKANIDTIVAALLGEGSATEAGA